MPILSLQQAIEILQQSTAVVVDNNYLCCASPKEDDKHEEFLELRLGDPEHPDNTYTFRRATNQLVKCDDSTMWLHAEDEDARVEIKLLSPYRIAGRPVPRFGALTGTSFSRAPLPSVVFGGSRQQTIANWQQINHWCACNYPTWRSLMDISDHRRMSSKNFARLMAVTLVGRLVEMEEHNMEELMKARPLFVIKGDPVIPRSDLDKLNPAGLTPEDTKNVLHRTKVGDYEIKPPILTQADIDGMDACIVITPGQRQAIQNLLDHWKGANWEMMPPEFFALYETAMQALPPATTPLQPAVAEPMVETGERFVRPLAPADNQTPDANGNS